MQRVVSSVLLNYRADGSGALFDANDLGAIVDLLGESRGECVGKLIHPARDAHDLTAITHGQQAQYHERRDFGWHSSQCCKLHEGRRGAAVPQEAPEAMPVVLQQCRGWPVRGGWIAVGR